VNEGKRTTANDVPEFGSEGYYRQLCEHAGVALIGTDLDLHIRTWNAAAARMFGAAADRMIGTSILTVIPQERRDAAEHMLRKAISTGQTIQFEFDHRDDHGRRRELAGTIAAVMLPSGTCIGASLWIRDITRRIRLQDDLNESRKMAALGELAGAIAHHFNNILGGVITSIDFASASGDPELTARVLKQTVPALQRAAAILTGLQAFAEGDQRSDDLADFTEILNQTADEIERKVHGKNIHFALTAPKLPVTPIPRAPVTTIFRNITQNAIEAMPEGGRLSIHVALEKSTIVTRVTDTGRGLSDTQMSRVFEPFWSTKGRLTTTTEEGTGLGLATAHGLAQMIGGSITVSSQPGQGSCFTVSIPREADD